MNHVRAPRPSTPRGRSFAVRPALWLGLLAFGPAASAAEPARLLPAQGLAAYGEYDGLDRHADAWSATAASAIFDKTPAGAMIADIARQLVDHLAGSKNASDGPSPVGADLLALREHLVRRGFAIGLYDEAERGASLVVVLNGMGGDDARSRAGRLVRAVARTGAKPEGPLGVPLPYRGRDMRLVRDLPAAWPMAAALKGAAEPKEGAKAPGVGIGLAWWSEGDDLVLVAGPNAAPPKDDALSSPPPRVDAVIAAIRGDAPSAAAHPGRATASAEGQDLKGFESAGLFFVELGAATGLYARLSGAIGGLGGAYEGVKLPSGKYMRDDVRYFPADPNFPADLTSPAKGSRPAPPAPGESLTKGRPAAEASKVAEAPPRLVADTPVPRPPADRPEEDPKTAGRDPAVAKAGGPTARSGVEPAVTAKALGLDGITRIAGRWGFRGKALLTDVRVVAPAPRRGLARLFDQPAFRKDRLPPVPRHAGEVLISGCDPVRTYEELVATWLGAAGPLVGDADKELLELTAHEFESMAFELTGQRLRDDLLGHFGPTCCLYTDESAPFPTLLVEVDDAKAFGKVLDSLARHLERGISWLSFPSKSKKASAGPPSLALGRLPAPDRGYRLISPAADVAWLGKELEPTIVVGESHVAMAANLAAARAALAAASRPAERWAPEGELAAALDALPSELTSLSVGDPRDSAWPAFVSTLPKLVQYIVTTSEAIEGKPSGESPAAKLLSMFGVPPAGGFRLKLDPARVPKAAALRAPLFPSVTATAVDDGGVRLIAQDAVPFACSIPKFRWSNSSKGGATLEVEVRPILLPCVRLTLAHSAKEPGGSIKFSAGWRLSVEDESDD